MANGRHSFVAFYPSDWMAGVARLPRLHRSVYFDVCCYIWDAAKPVPERELVLMIADLPNGREIIDDLVAIGKLERREDGSISNPKALHEAEKAYGAWQRMSDGGRNARSRGDDKGDGGEGSNGSPENQNQNQNHTSPKREKKRATRPDDVSEGVWKAFNDQRKTVFTPLALDGFRREASKIGWSVEDALRESVERGWQGFKADWIKEAGNGRDRSGWNRALNR